MDKSQLPDASLLWHYCGPERTIRRYCSLLCSNHIPGDGEDFDPMAAIKRGVELEQIVEQLINEPHAGAQAAYASWKQQLVAECCQRIVNLLEDRFPRPYFEQHLVRCYECKYFAIVHVVVADRTVELEIAESYKIQDLWEQIVNICLHEQESASPS